MKKSIYTVMLCCSSSTTIPAMKRWNAIVEAFRALCAELPFVQDFEWGRNSSTENLNEGYTHCFIVTFADEKGP